MLGGDILYFLQIKSLLGTKVEWLYYILQAFNSGDLVRYQELCHVHNAALSAQPALVENEKKLLEKINILCLMEIIFRFSICLLFYIIFYFVLPLICARGLSLS
jgi:26S proteasome regulatory subunit N9